MVSCFCDEEGRNTDMRKIAIVTFHAANNYGAVLQNYALQKKIKEDFALEVETIDYRCDAIDGEYKIWEKRDKLRRQVWNVVNLMPELIRRWKFNSFRKKHLKLSSCCTIADIEKYNDIFDVYICGSDQIWNKDIIKDNTYVYSLEFVATHPKMAYAASAGKGIIQDKVLLENIKKLNYITVRERELRDFLIKQGVVCSCVCDPVFLLDKAKWMTFVTERKKRDYLFLYYIDSKKELCEKIAEMIAREQGKEICCPCKIEKSNMCYKYKTYGTGPIEFLSDIYYADMIVASSFHAIAFSIIFEKEFVAVLHEKTGQRVIDLLEYVGLSNRIVKDYDSFMEKKWEEIDYSLVREKVRKWSNESKSHLKIMCEWQHNE